MMSQFKIKIVKHFGVILFLFVKRLIKGLAFVLNQTKR